MLRRSNGAFLNWMADRQEPRRPFFAFLNLLDVHAPYRLPPGGHASFRERSPYARRVPSRVRADGHVIDKTTATPALDLPARDSYDDCLVYPRRATRPALRRIAAPTAYSIRRLIIVTSDHGEGLGEHDLFDHGESLYRAEVRVPLIIVPPSGLNPSAVVAEPVSLCDLPVTIVDLVGQGKGSPFPGYRCHLCADPRTGAVLAPRGPDPAVSELSLPQPMPLTKGDRRFPRAR